MVLISSLAGLKPGSRIPAYDASKAAQIGLARHAALEGARRGIRVNTVAPGLIDTPLGRLASAGRPGRAVTRIPLDRQGTAWEVAAAVRLAALGGGQLRDRAGARRRRGVVDTGLMRRPLQALCWVARSGRVQNPARAAGSRPDLRRFSAPCQVFAPRSGFVGQVSKSAVQVGHFDRIDTEYRVTPDYAGPADLPGYSAGGNPPPPAPGYGGHPGYQSLLAPMTSTSVPTGPSTSWPALCLKPHSSPALSAISRFRRDGLQVYGRWPSSWCWSAGSACAGARYLAPVYSVIEGLALGSVSKLCSSLGHGIVPTAIIFTTAAVFVGALNALSHRPGEGHAPHDEPGLHGRPGASWPSGSCR